MGLFRGTYLYVYVCGDRITDVVEWGYKMVVLSDLKHTVND